MTSSTGSTSTKASIDPLACFPYIRVRSISESGIRRLVTLGTQQEKLKSICKYNFTVVEFAQESCEEEVLKFLETDLKMGKEAAVTRYKKFDKWYGMVDGTHRLLALLRLIEKGGKWKHFVWDVCVMEQTKTHNLRAFARNSNSLHNSTSFIKPTVYDMLQSIHEDYHDYKKELSRNKFNITEVYRCYRRNMQPRRHGSGCLPFTGGDFRREC